MCIRDSVFDYGAEGGLVKITRTAPDMSIVNRLSGMGGTRNVPMNYFTSRYSNFPPDPNPINDTVYIRNIMPKVFREMCIRDRDICRQGEQCHRKR